VCSQSRFQKAIVFPKNPWQAVVDKSQRF